MRKISLVDAAVSARLWLTFDRSDWRKLGRITVLASIAWALVMGVVIYQTNGFHLGMAVPAHASECLLPSTMTTEYAKLACRISSGDHFAYTE